LTPGYGFGIPLAPIAGTSAAFPTLPPAPPTSVGLQPLRPGAVPVQAGDIRAPPILIVPEVTLFEGYTNNPRNTPNTLSDSVSHFGAGTTISVDSVRLQGQLNTSLDYYRYARAVDQDTLDVNLLGYGLGTIIQDHVFVDGRAAITQLSRSGGVGFANSTLIPPSQQTQAEVISLSPIVRESIDGYVDSELRYNYGMNLFHNGSLLSTSAATVPTPAVPSTSPSNATTNDATLSLATGRRFTFFGSKLTLDAREIDSQSAAQSTQLRGYDDVEYQFNQQFAALARAGYEDVRYPLQPAATTIGPIWQIGGRLTPFPGSYLVVHYGRQDGFYGASGALRYEVTPATTILASVQNNLSSSQQEILTNLNSSQVDSYGNIVNQVTGLPSALANPEFSYASNNIYRQKQMRIGMQTTVGRNTFGIFGFFDRRAALGTSSTGATGAAAILSGSDSTVGANLNWSRSLAPNLTSAAALGYAIEQAASQKTLTADWRLTYTLNAKLNAVLHYQFINVDSANVTGGSASGVGSYRRNLVEIGVTRSF
jgi:uncharacterized protein (PEP-CTERM system associated)